MKFFLDKLQYIVLNTLRYTKYSPTKNLSNPSCTKQGEIKWQA